MPAAASRENGAAAYLETERETRMKQETEIHDPFSPSGASRLMKCPGSYRMQKGIEDEDSEASIRGTRLHELIPRLAIGAAVGVEPDVEPEDRQTVEQCIEFLRSVVPDGWTIHFEEKVEIWSFRTFERITDGTADIVAVSPDGKDAILIDWKFGRVKVPAAADNWQLALYATGVAQKFGVDRVTAFVYQPFVFGNSEPYEFTKFGMIAETYARQVRIAKLPRLELNPSEACRYCRAADVCPALQFVVDGFAADMGTDAGRLVTPENAEAKFETAKIVSSWSERVDDAFRKLVEARAVPGWEMTEKPPRREIPDAEKAFEAVSFNLTREDFDKLVSVSVPVGKLEAAIVDAIRRNHEGEKKITVKAAKKIAKDLLAPVVVKKSGGWTPTRTEAAPPVAETPPAFEGDPLFTSLIDKAIDGSNDKREGAGL